ncbi:YaaR family protein [Selenomonas montiformis]|uniref:YaaR family protein n=1 Tax=Selenomonas montiformis TaxID=2652285 RepID=UPI002A8E2423|nr:YaaR family protein [Selenomonas montiformis]
MPMKIDTTTARGTSLSMTRSAEEEHVHDAETDFSAELLEQNGRVTSEQMDKLLRQIDEQGARLSRTPTYDELKSYRTLIRNFVGEAVNSMYELHTQAGWDRMGRQKVYTTVRKIDKKLEEMAEKIRLGQADQLDVAASHDVIRGLLVDLYM